MHKEFCKETALNWFFSTFWKYKPCYLFLSTEREKEFCPCKICQNVHSPLAAINTFRRSQNLLSHKYVSNFLSVDLLKPGFQVNEIFEANSTLYPDFIVKRILITIYLNRRRKSIAKTERRKFTARVDKRESLNLVVQNLMNKEVKYLKQRSYFRNISTQFPIIK